MAWWHVVILILVTASLEREVVFLVFILAVPAMLIRETLMLARRRNAGATETAHERPSVFRRAIGFRLLAWLALALAIGNSVVSQLGWSHEYTEVLTGVLLVAALVSVLAARTLGKQRDA